MTGAQTSFAFGVLACPAGSLTQIKLAAFDVKNPDADG